MSVCGWPKVEVVCVWLAEGMCGWPKVLMDIFPNFQPSQFHLGLGSLG